MGVIHKKSRTTGKRPRRTGEKVAQNTGIDFLALRLGVVLSLPTEVIQEPRGPLQLYKGIKRVRGAPPGTKKSRWSCQKWS